MFFLVPSLPRLLCLKAKHEYRQLYVILDKVEVLREQKFSQGQNHNYRKGKLDYRRRFNTQLIITLFLMWWLLKEPFDLIRSCCPPYFLAAFFGDFFATFSAGFLGTVGLFLAEEFASDMLIILEPSELTHEMIPWSAQGNVIPRERTTEETGLLPKWRRPNCVSLLDISVHNEPIR